MKYSDAHTDTSLIAKEFQADLKEESNCYMITRAFIVSLLLLKKSSTDINHFDHYKHHSMTLKNF